MKMLRTVQLFLFVLLSNVCFADEGMWLPQLLAQLNEKQMKALGMKITAADIYNVNRGSLKDAIVSFGGFCTGEVISDQGLVLTNHHCGFDAIQNHSSLDKNYLRDGFWARSRGEELPNPDLFVTFIISINDVTSAVLKNVTAGMSEAERQSAIDQNIAAVRKGYVTEKYQETMVRPFYDGNKYFLFVTETYRDVRLVGAPPSSIGNFGKDTDNWMWPRHTGDFSMFRIYAGKDNKPAAYSVDNVPYKPKKSLSISLDGAAQNDFTMVFGFPGRTTEYLPSAAIEQIITMNDPTKIAIRDRALKVIDGFMRRDEGTRIQYAAKYANIQNAYKKWQGEVLGMDRTGGLAKKRAYEASFTSRLKANPVLLSKYGNLLPDLTSAYSELKPFSEARDYQNEIIPRLEIFSVAAMLNGFSTSLNKDGVESFRKNAGDMRTKLEDFYREYDPTVDKAVFNALIPLYAQHISGESALASALQRSATPEKFVSGLYEQSILDDKERVMTLWEKDPVTALQTLMNDEAFKLYLSIVNNYVANYGSRIAPVQARINALQRAYMQAQMDVFADKKFYPDANSTLRVAYGKVAGFEARDAVHYDYYTYFDGVMEKYVPGDYEFDLPQGMIDLYKRKDYGIYAAANGRLPVCFLGTNHTTGGNSGSPALDAYGNLIGLNFDRVWEGTMSDLNYDPSICRNIMVDIRYVLFIIDKFAGAKNLVNEMKLVHPKKLKAAA